MITVDKKSSTPIYEQIIEEIKREILTDVLKSGEMLPSVRELSAAISASPNTIQKAFAELENIGVAVSSPGIGRHVSENAKEKLQKLLKGKIFELEELVTVLKNGGVDIKDVEATVNKVYGKSTRYSKDASLSWLD